MKLTNIVSTEKFVEKLDNKVFPIAIIKFMLNKRKIMYYFKRAADEDFETNGINYKADPSDCEICISKKNLNILCRQHTSIKRVLSTDSVVFDLDTNTYFYKNEIFRMVGNRLVIVYCPHTKLIMGDISEEKVRKVIPITIEDPSVTELPKYKNVRKILSSELMDRNMKCWFNNEFSIVTIPDDRNNSNWCLITNK